MASGYYDPNYDPKIWGYLTSITFDPTIGRFPWLNKWDMQKTELEKDDWPDTGSISIKVKNGKSVKVVNGHRDGSEWKVLSITNGDTGIDSLNDWAEGRGFKWDQGIKDNAVNIIKKYRTNAANNAAARTANNKIIQKDEALRKIIDIARNVQTGDYLTTRNNLENFLKNYSAVLNSNEQEDLVNQFTEHYKKHTIANSWAGNNEAVEDLSKLDPRLMGGFNADWYGNTYKSNGRLLKDVWAEAERNKDVDILNVYGNKQNYYFHHYTTRGKQAGNRGNPIELTAQADAYREEKPTDQEIQQLRERQLGVNLASSSERLLAVPYIATEWEKAKNGDPYWKELAKENYLDVEKEDEFAALFRLSNRDEDKQVVFTNNLNSDYGISELEDAIAQAAGEKAVVDVKKFGALAQDTLKAAIDEIKKAKQQEQMMDFYKGFEGFSEIVNINDTLTNSLLGDLNMGGMLPLGDKFEKSLEEGIGKITGINNNIAYNWQNWFDNTLSERYKENIELGLTPEEANQKIKIDAEFLQGYLDDYLIPRFDESRSMNEFVEYIDVRQEEQNPFQTQDLLNALKIVADLQAETFVNTINKQEARGFDADFYFNPTGDDARASDYAAQSEQVNNDWARAQQNLNSLVDPNDKDSTTWAQQIYRFGLDPTSDSFKDDFARMHFQIIGQGKGYDAAEDILNASKVKDFIYGKILPLLEDETERIGTVFGEFIKPEEFADDVLEGLDPNTPEDWEKVLEDLGIEDFKGSLEELREYIADAVRTGSAEDIRRSIKYLNEQREKPTQQNLGITYIQREEDEAPEKVKAETQLYQSFVNAGYSGTEDEFYEKFMPDANREEMALATAAGKGKGFSFDFGDFSDPFASMASIQSFFPDEDDDQQEDDEEQKSDSDSSFFDLSLDLDSPSTKSKAAQSLLGEFTAGFKFN